MRVCLFVSSSRAVQGKISVVNPRITGVSCGGGASLSQGSDTVLAGVRRDRWAACASVGLHPAHTAI